MDEEGGGPEGDRTPDLLNAIQARSQLRHRPTYTRGRQEYQKATAAIVSLVRPSSEPRLFEYTIENEFRVLAGRSEEDNDILSLRVARPNDYWFHAHGVPGSHVILQGPDGVEPDKATLKVAAAVAAYHSKARGGGVVPVSCTKAQNVSKPRGAKPGTVQIRKETTIKVRPGLPPNSSVSG